MSQSSSDTSNLTVNSLMNYSSAKNDESRTTKFFRVACHSSLEQIVLGCDKSRLAEIYSPAIQLKPATLDKIHSTVIKLAKTQFKETLETLIDEHKLDEKFKVLETLAEEKRERKKKQKTWRPTGLSPEEQVRAHDLEKKEAIVTSLRELVAAKEIEVKELQKQVAAVRVPVPELEVKVGKCMTTAATEFDSCKNLIDTVNSSSDDN